MTAFNITVQDQGVRDALNQLLQRSQNLQPVLIKLGEDITERTKRRFETSIDPAGQPWRPNTTATLAMLAARLGKTESYSTKAGGLNQHGMARIANKKPLIGESERLRNQIVWEAGTDTLSVRATETYAAIHQFGGRTSPRSLIPNKIIPARPFMPIMENGRLYPQESADIMQAINDYLIHGL
jgi:phage virion morphogenesis protein